MGSSSCSGTPASAARQNPSWRAIALSASLAFGLGNRDLAGEVTRNWYNRYKAERESIDRENAAQDAADRTDEFESESGGF